MKRRNVLQSAGAIGLAALAGCLQQGNGSGGAGTPTDSPSESPMLVDSSFSVTGTMSGQPTQKATVEFGDGEVTVTGTTTGSDGCYTAVLDSATVEDGSLSVTVKAKRKSDAGDMCTQALVEIDYEATFTFDGGLPGSVTVVHDSQGSRHDVTTANR